MHLIDYTVFDIVATFLNYSVSKYVDEVSKVEIVGGASRRSTNSRHLTKL